MDWKIGAEIELLAPKGMSRKDLAEAIAKEQGGHIRPFFHPQIEPSKVSEQPLFHNLTQGFEIADDNGGMIAQCVDDLTLQDDCNKSTPPKSGWYRIVSDEPRLLQLVMQQGNASMPVSEVLSPTAALFGTEPQHNQGGMVRVTDRTGAAIAIAAPLPGERERPCELITAPMEENYLGHLESLLGIARELGFTIPKEGATHIHFDAAPLRSTKTLANLTRLLWTFDSDLKRLLETNPRCRRLGKWSQPMYDFLQSPEFSRMPFAKAMQSLSAFEPSKYCDFNLKNMVYPASDKHTFEIRILPVWLHGRQIIEAAGLFESMLRWAMNTPEKVAIPPDMNTLLNRLPVDEEIRAIWQKRLRSKTVCKDLKFTGL